MKNLGAAELEIMQIIWKAREPVASTYILSKLDYKEEVSKSLLENVYEGSFEDLVSSLVHVKKPKKEELQEILDMLKKEL